MRKNIVAGNWKMNTTVPEGVQLAKDVVAKAAEVPAEVGLIVATPFTHLCAVAGVVGGTRVELSAQNCADKEKGAYTGEVSVDMIKSTGAGWTILGHSERRQYYGETDAKLVEKVKLALAAGLKVILCVGENLDEREAGKHFDVVKAQTENVLFNFTAEDMKNIVAAASPPTPRNSSPSPTSTAASSAAPPSKPTTSSASHYRSKTERRPSLQLHHHGGDAGAGGPEPDFASFEMYDLEGGLFCVEVVAGRPGCGAVHRLTFGGRHFVQSDDIEIRHVVGVYAEFAALSVETDLAGERVVAEDGIALDFQADGAVELEIVRQVVLPAACEAEGEQGDYGQTQLHFTVTSFIITSLEPSALVISALRMPFPGMTQRPSGPVLTGRPLKVQEISSFTLL